MIRLRSVLKPLVTVEDESISDLFFIHGLAYGFGDKLKSVIALEYMRHDKTIVQVLDGG